MKAPQILTTRKDLSIPWYEQIRKTVRLPENPELQTFYSIKPPDYVTALMKTGGEKIVILRQYRPAVEKYTLELPSGHVEQGETPHQAVLRELREETNCEADTAILLGELIPDTGRLENRLWAFYVNNVEIRQFRKPEDNDGIEVILVSTRELLEMINKGMMNHALDLSVITLAILQKYLKL